MENRYDKYKDSGIAWIGEIPEHWEIVCLKRLSKISTGNQDTQDSTPDGKYPFFVRSPKVEKSNRYTFEGPSILMAGDGVGAGKIFHLADNKFACHQRVYCINQLSKINRIFLFYYLSSLFYNIIDSANSKSTVDSVRLPMLAEFPICIPLDIEQQTIAAYLDQKCGEIDEVITLQEEMITKLQSYKQSVITEAVTKGLDKNVPLKDSGIEWIGEIPKHWSKNKIIRLFSIIGSGTTPKSSKEDNYNGSVNWIQSGDINGGDIEICKNTISYTAFKEYPALKIYQAPFVIVAMYGASVGNISISQIDGCVNQACCVMNETKQNFKYLFYAMNSVKKYLIYRAEGGGQPNISQDKIKNTWLPIPPLSEQQSIADYLDQRCSEIDELISIKQQKIEKLKEYRKSLIFECVTGKRKVS